MLLNIMNVSENCLFNASDFKNAIHKQSTRTEMQHHPTVNVYSRHLCCYYLAERVQID